MPESELRNLSISLSSLSLNDFCIRIVGSPGEIIRHISMPGNKPFSLLPIG